MNSTTSSATSTSTTSHSQFYRVTSPTFSSSSTSSAFSTGIASDELIDKDSAQFQSTLPKTSQYRSSSSEQSSSDDEENDIDEAAEPTDTARINRKVLDLEISNTSLLSINRTLEKEMRTQSRELRALKRWIQRNGAADIDLAEISVSEADSDDETSKEQDDDDDDTILPKTKQSSSLADMMKGEQDLFSVNQALNSSISKCISSSDFLIKEAIEALEFTVTENEMRSRVLSYDDSTNKYNEDEQNYDSDSGSDANEELNASEKKEV